MRRSLVAALWLCLAVAWGAWIRIDTAQRDPGFDPVDARGLLRSDPALLLYITGRIAAAGGVPDDFRADPRIQHPYTTDVPAEFPVGQEFLVAWAQGLLGDAPLHVTALRVMAVCAALFVLGIYAAVRAMTASRAWGALAVLLALVTPANYRTIGFVLVGEDLSLPLFVLHLGWLAVALRTRTARDFLAAGGFAAAALATWHAMGFVVLLELGVLLLGCLWSGRSPLETPRAWLVLVPPAVAGLCVPVLRANGLLLSPAAALALALAVPALVRRRRPVGPNGVRALALGALVVALPLAGAFAPDSYDHVRAVVWAKLRFLGRFPEDPTAIPFDARLLWQGPFETLSPQHLLAWSGWPLAVLFVAGLVTLRLRPGASGYERLLFGLALVALPAGWMFARLAVLAGLFAPVAAALALARWERRGRALALFGALALAQLVLFVRFVDQHRIVWYLPPAARSELVSLIEWVGGHVPAGEPIAGDFVNSPEILAHTGHPIVLQPKYETDRSRRQAQAFLETFFHGTAEDLARLLRERFRCRYLLVDRFVLWELSRTTAGLRQDERAPRPGTAAEELLADEPDALAAIPAFELLYRGKSGVAGADYRVFALR